MGSLPSQRFPLPILMPLPVTKLEMRILAILALLIVLGLIGMFAL